MKKQLQLIADRYLDRNLGISQFLGITRNYGKCPDLSKAGIAKDIAEAKSDFEIVNKMGINRDSINAISFLEFRIVQTRLEAELFNLTEQQEFKTSISPYFSPLFLINYAYTARSYAPLEQRIEHIIQVEEAIPRLIKNAFENLDKQLPKAKLEVGMLQLQGTLSYLRDELIEFVMQSEDTSLIERWSRINATTVEAIENFLQTFKMQYVPNTISQFALGEKLYLDLLKYQELVDISKDRLEKIAMADLERNYSAMQSIITEKGKDFLDTVKQDHPSLANLMEEGTTSMNRCKQFVIDKDIISIPEGTDPIVTETAKSWRPIIFAAYNSANIGEDSEATETYYYITPPDPSWTEEKIQSFLKGFYLGGLDSTSMHEVWPGHHLHFLHIKNQPSKIIRQMGFSIATLEGWAHYVEELGYELGYDLYDPIKFRVGQLQLALMRNCRFVASIAMHTGNMTMEEAQILFNTKGLMQQENSIMEARRGTVDPMYLNYTLGKLMIMKLREDYKHEKEAKGKIFSLKEFHDEFMSYGASPIPLIRELMLENPGNDVL